MTTVITEAEVYCESDPKRAVVLVSRSAGGKYKAVKADGQPLPKLGDGWLFESYDEAVKAAEAFGAAFDSGPDGAAAAAGHLAQVQADRIVEQANRVAELEAEAVSAAETAAKRIANLEAQLAAK